MTAHSQRSLPPRARPRRGAAPGDRWSLLLMGLAVPVAGLGAGSPERPTGVPHAEPIPAFSRQFRTSCSTCHAAMPKLNVLGEAFRLNGYRMPESELLYRIDEPIPLGAEEWKEEWPRAIWPSDLPGKIPLAIRIQSDIHATRDETEGFSLTYRFPHEVYFLAGTGFGESLGVFLEAEWSREESLRMIQAKLAFQDILPFLPERSLNLWAGLQNPYLLTFTDRQIDRAGRQRFLWQDFRAHDLTLVDGGGNEVTAANDLELGRGVPAVEMNGILTGRLYWAAGLAQGGGDGTEDMNDRKDFYYKLRYKLGGLNLRGRYAKDDGPVPRTGGQLLDRSLTVEHFGYFGDESTDENPAGSHRALGASVRALWGPLDLGVGYVARDFERPWALAIASDLEFRTVFGKVEYLVFPWVTGSLKAERATVALTDPASSSLVLAGGDQTRILPGVILLLRQNLRVVVEGEIFTRHEESALLGNRRPHNLWVRLDIAF